MQKIVIATNNEGKKKEIKQILNNFELLTLKEIIGFSDVTCDNVFITHPTFLLSYFVETIYNPYEISLKTLLSIIFSPHKNFSISILYNIYE